MCAFSIENKENIENKISKNYWQTKYCVLKYSPLKAKGNCVTAAQQTLTLYVGVRIPIPLPKKNRPSTDGLFFLSFGCGIVASNHSAEPCEARGSHFASKPMGARSYKARAKIFALRIPLFHDHQLMVCFSFLCLRNNLFANFLSVFLTFYPSMCYNIPTIKL